VRAFEHANSASLLGLKKQMPSTAIQYIADSRKRLEAGIGELFEKVEISEKKFTSSITVVLGPDGTLHEQRFAGAGTHLSRCHALITGLFTLDFVEQFTQPHAGFV
jgi:hypothetical protein